jgi:hypothetical protein
MFRVALKRTRTFARGVPVALVSWVVEVTVLPALA